MKSFLHNHRYQLLFLALIATAPFLNILNNEFVSDDIFAFVRFVKAGNDYRNFWEQVKTLSLADILFSLNYLVSKQGVFLYHLLNITFHLLTVLSAYTLICLIFNHQIAFFSAGFFAIHPIQTEVVAWISARPYSIYSFLTLTAFILFILSQRGKKIKIYYFCSLLTFFLAIFSSPNAGVLPLLIALYLLVKHQLKNRWRLILPFLGITFFYALYLIFQTKFRISYLNITSPSSDKSLFYNPLLQVPTAISSYLALLVWPKNLSLYHEDFNLTPFWLAIRSIITLTFLVNILFFYKKDKKIFFGLSFFLIALLPILIPLKIAWIVAERYVYLASLGFFMFLAILLEKAQKISQIKNLSYILFFSLIAIYSFLTFQRNNDWQNQDTLWLATVKASPNSPKAHNNMGDVYGRQGDLKKSLAEFQKAVELKPDYADATHNIGNTYRQMGNVEKAIEYFQKAIKLNPRLVESYIQLAVTAMDKNDFNQAINWINKGLAANPNSANLYNVLGIFEFNKGNVDQAKQHFIKAIELDPDFPHAKKNLGLITGNQK